MVSLTPDDIPAVDDWNRLLDGCTAVVTGGGAGIGRATVELFVAHGAEVHVAEADPDLEVDVGTLEGVVAHHLSLIHISEPTRPY